MKKDSTCRLAAMNNSRSNRLFAPRPARRFVSLLALVAPIASPAADVHYSDIAPILETRCVMCHQGPAAPLGLRLDSLDGLLAGSSDGPVVVAGDPEGSELLRRLRGTSLPRMPMTGPPFLDDEESRPRMPFDGPPYLSGSEIELIEQWIEDGARNSLGERAPVPVGEKVRLHGTLDSQGRLDGLELVIGRNTRIDDQPRAGDYVQVRGRIAPDGSVVVERLRERD